jgi:hypothetical protein
MSETITLLGGGTPPTDQMPYTDYTYTTMSTVVKYPAVANIRNLTVFDAHKEIWEEKAKPLYEMVSSNKKFIDITTLENSITLDVWYNRYGRHFSNLFCYMIAHALEHHVQPTLYFHGAWLIDKEYQDEVSNLSYMIGVAKARGCSILIARPSRLLPLHTYGFGKPVDRREP